MISASDPAKEFAERVAGQWCIGTNMDGKEVKLPGYDSLVDLIANELRAGGWVQDEDAADIAVARKALDELEKDPSKGIRGKELEMMLAKLESKTDTLCSNVRWKNQ